MSRIKWSLFIVAGLLSANLAWAAPIVEIILEDKERYEGKIEFEDKKEVTISTSDDEFLTFKRSEIDEIRYKEPANLKLLIANKTGPAVLDLGNRPVPGARKKRSSLLWPHGRVSLSAALAYPLGSYADIFPNGFSGEFAYDHGLDKIWGKRYALLPGLRATIGYSIFDNTPNSISGSSIMAGPIWQFAFWRSHKGRLVTGFVSGISRLSFQGRDKKNRQFDLTTTLYSFNAFAGYEYPWGDNVIGYRINFGYITDPNDPFMNIGVQVGLSHPLD